MTDAVTTIPSIRVFRDKDDCFTFMELAEIDPGHAVGWGKLVRMDRAAAQAGALIFVSESLDRFFERDGRVVKNRLRLTPGELAAATHTMVAVRLHTADIFTVQGYLRSGSRRVESDTIVERLARPSSPMSFISVLDNVFDRADES